MRQLSPEIQAYVNAGAITLARATSLRGTQEDHLNTAHIRQLIDDQVITVEQAIELTIDQRRALENHEIRQRVTEGTLDLRLAHIPHAQAYVNAGAITLARATSLRGTQEDRLNTAHIRQLIDDQVITVEQAIELTIDQSRALENQVVLEMLYDGRLHPELQGTPNIDTILITARNRCEIRKNARLLAQGSRDDRTNNFSFFKLLSDEVNVKIAGLTGEPEVHSEKLSEEIAYKNFCKPEIK